MVRPRPNLPSGHGELLLRPAYEEWPALLERNRSAAATWSFRVAGVPATELREKARGEALVQADVFSRRLRVPVAAPGPAMGPIVMTGHQPELYHPGVWVKDFLLQRIGGDTAATAVDVVVDSDGFDSVQLVSPCLTPEVRRCRQYLAIGSEKTCFACGPKPSGRDLELFCEAGDRQLASLPAPSIRRHFASFCDALRSAENDAENLGELVTFARRRYEASAGTDYLELPVSAACRTEAFATFVVDLAMDAARFADAYNTELEAFRSFTKTRSKVQPFPDLQVDEGSVELPLWALGQGQRDGVWASRNTQGIELKAGGRTIVQLPEDPRAAVRVLLSSQSLIAPKALALTLFLRLFACDLFIHGVGGGRYDNVTNGVCRRYYGVEPPEFAVASLTMYLPLGAHIVTEEEVSAARERLNRLEHNPNQVLGEVEFDDPDERARAHALAAEKDSLVEAIASPDADKKQLGGRIRAVNLELSELLQPLKQLWIAELAALESQREASEVFTDRGYPFCFWSPADIADKVW